MTNNWQEAGRYLLEAVGEGGAKPLLGNLHIVFDPALSGQLQLQLEHAAAANPALRNRMTFYTYSQNNHEMLVQVLRALKV